MSTSSTVLLSATLRIDTLPAGAHRKAAERRAFRLSLSLARARSRSRSPLLPYELPRMLQSEHGRSDSPTYLLREYISRIDKRGGWGRKGGGGGGTARRGIIYWPGQVLIHRRQLRVHHHVAELRFCSASAACQRVHHAMEGVPAPEAVREHLRITRILRERRRESNRKRKRERVGAASETQHEMRISSSQTQRRAWSLTIRSGSSNAAANSCGCSTASLYGSMQTSSDLAAKNSSGCFMKYLFQGQFVRPTAATTQRPPAGNSCNQHCFLGCNERRHENRRREVER